MRYGTDDCSIYTDSYFSKIPDKFDWRDHGAVSPIKNQGHCGDCYLFSAVAALESQYMIKNPGVTPDFSEQTYLDCSKRDCRGYFPFKVWDYIHTKNVTDEKNNPYSGLSNNNQVSVCHYRLIE